MPYVSHEPDDLETLYMKPELKGKFVSSQVIAIAPLKNREMSIILSKTYTDETPMKFMHIIFTEEEVDLIIKAMQEVKIRWVEGRVI